ncbi:F-box protein At4g18380-like [Olea europaea var. sylvestris]|uniref:F-box At5g46170-like n=1 Tax=Olea europaea subsp. europaea TaxID=158383 RepID=A0A8S0S3F6_OLEEU|nr:F-box protein At4g18380-like [Olea europaea var. sylvestris]XP_022892411.1 F-box protein At4g18380-like [Olea europaea var. sylvestris]CAA2986178.1 F-box At5g46170-like [Olea europaea subsp. europaea]
MGSMKLDLYSRIYPEPVDHFDMLPDSIILIIFNKIGDVKALGRCCVVSKRFHSLVPQVDNVVVRVDCVISDENSSISGTSAASASTADKSRHPISSLFRLFFSGLYKSLTQLMTSSPRRPIVSNSEDFNFNMDQNSVTHHSPTQVLKNFDEIKFLKIELPNGELGIEEGILLKWKADFGSTLDNCVILGASSVIQAANAKKCSSVCNNDNNGAESDNGSIPESFYTNGGLKLRVVWTITSLMAASARHYLLQPIIVEHKTLETLVLTDGDGQGVLSMNKEQLEELRVKPLSASSASKRTLVPALSMRLWYAAHLELPNGSVLKGATLVAIRPSEQPKEVLGSEASWVASAFEEPFGTAARMLVKRRTYCLEMNSF